MPLTDADLWGTPARSIATTGAMLSDEDLWGAPDNGGGAKNLKAGFIEGLTSLPETIMGGLNSGPGGMIEAAEDLAARFDPKTRAAAKAAGLTPKQYADRFRYEASVQHTLNKQLGPSNPEDVTARTPGERIARGVGAGLSGALIPSGEALTVGRMLANGLIGAASGGTGAGLAEVAPEPLKPAAQLVGGLVGGVGTAKGLRAAEGASLATRGVADSLTAGVNPAAAERVAATTLAKRATAPQTVGEMLAQPAEDLVPGSKPTTFQATGDMGLGALEREQRTRNPVPFAEREGEQNAARVAALGDIQVGGDPNALATGLRQQFDALDAETQAHVDRLTAAAQEKGANLKGEAPPEAHGETIRGAIAEAEGAARARESGLWNAIDPEGKLTGNVGHTRQAAKSITEDIPSTAKPLAGEEAAIFKAATDMPALAPVSDLIALRSRVSTEMRNELIANGRSASYARLTQLRGAIQANLADSISHAVAHDDALVARGVIDPLDAAGAKVQAWADEFRRAKAEATGTFGPAGLRSPAGGPEAALPGGGRAEGEGPGGPGSDAGAQGLPGNVPTFDEAAAQRLAAATQATKERARQFGLNPVKPVLDKAGGADVFKLPEARVPAKFFHPGPTGYTDMQALFKAVGLERGLAIIQDYAASSLRKAAMREDGTLDPAKYQRWTAAHADALRALPDGIRTEFASAAQASRAVQEASAARITAIKEAQAGAIGRIMGVTDPADIPRIVGQILGSRTAATEMRLLAKATKDNPAAREGLRQAIADHMLTKYVGNTESQTTGVNQIKADGLQTFLKQNRPALAHVFTEAELASMDAIAQDINRSKRSQNALRLPGNSNTAMDAAAQRGHTASASPFRRTLLDVIGGAVGFAFHGPIGSLVGAAGTHLIQQLRQMGIERVDQLLTEAMLHPAVARELLKKAPAKPDTGSALGLRNALEVSARAQLAAHGANNR